jgi:hypothetical protein
MAALPSAVGPVASLPSGLQPLLGLKPVLARTARLRRAGRDGTSQARPAANLLAARLLARDHEPVVPAQLVALRR